MDSMDKRLLLVAQLFITFFMATTMSGIMSAVGMGLTREWLLAWPCQIPIAWPIAFLFTQAYGPLGFALAARIVPRRD